MNESHDPRRPFKVVTTTSSSTASSCSLIWETLVKYGYMVSSFWIFTFFNCFLKSIFWFMFLSSNSLIKESNIFGVFREDTCGTSCSVIESTMIFLALIFFFLESVESNHFLLAQIPWMNESHETFKVVITTSAFSTSSSIASSCSLIWETLVKYDCMVFAF